MLRSTTLPSKIFATKKRLSSDKATLAQISLAFFGLFAVLIFMLRFESLDSYYGQISTEFPVLQSHLKDPTFHRFEETPRASLSKSTPVLVLSEQAFYFGELRSFTTDYADVRNKFRVSHKDGEPQLGTALEQLKKWSEERKEKSNITNSDGVLIFVPQGLIPMPIVLQVIENVKRDKFFTKVILANGMM